MTAGGDGWRPEARGSDYGCWCGVVGWSVAVAVAVAVAAAVAVISLNLFSFKLFKSS